MPNNNTIKELSAIWCECSTAMLHSRAVLLACFMGATHRIHGRRANTRLTLIGLLFLIRTPTHKSFMFIHITTTVLKHYAIMHAKYKHSQTIIIGCKAAIKIFVFGCLHLILVIMRYIYSGLKKHVESFNYFVNI